MTKTGHLPALTTCLHHCMFGSARKKHTKLLHTLPQMTLLGVLCDGSHDHQPWGRLPTGKWATASECAYPPKLCASMAHAFVTQLLSLGAVPSAAALELDHLALARAEQVATGKQPKGNFQQFVVLRGPAKALPAASKLNDVYIVPPHVQCHPAHPSLPARSRCIRQSTVWGDSKPGVSDCALTEMEFGLPWRPKDFVSKALNTKHPKDLQDGIPPALKEAIRSMVGVGLTSAALERTATLRPWMLRAKHLKEEGKGDLDMPEHCKDILKGKSTRFFEEMLNASDYPDQSLVRQVCNGFDLLGPIPDSVVLPKNSQPQLSRKRMCVAWRTSTANPFGHPPSNAVILKLLRRFTDPPCKNWKRDGW